MEGSTNTAEAEERARSRADYYRMLASVEQPGSRKYRRFIQAAREADAEALIPSIRAASRLLTEGAK